MSKMLTVLALTGNKQAAVYAAADELRVALVYAVRDGNTRNLTDTLDALRNDGAVTKKGEVRSGKKGAIFNCLLTASNAAQSGRETFLALHAGHKGKPTAAMTDDAARIVAPIVEAFEETAIVAIEPQKKTKGEGNAPATGEGNAPATGEGNAPVEGEGNAPATGEGVAPVQTLLSHAKRIIQIYRNRLAARDKHIAALEAEIVALRASVAPAQGKVRGKKAA